MISARRQKFIEARRRILRRRRRSMLFAGGLGLATALTIALSVASFNGVDLAAAAVTKAKSFADLMRQRSPG
jgi:hypothetical protein